MQLQHDFPLTNGTVQVMQPGMKEASHIVTCDKSHIFFIVINMLSFFSSTNHLRF